MLQWFYKCLNSLNPKKSQLHLGKTPIGWHLHVKLASQSEKSWICHLPMIVPQSWRMWSLQGTPPPNCFHSYTVFGKNGPNYRLEPLFGVDSPRLGNPESALYRESNQKILRTGTAKKLNLPSPRTNKARLHDPLNLCGWQHMVS